MKDSKVYVVMTSSGCVKQYGAVDTIQEVLEEVYQEFTRAGSNWDRPTKLFIDGKCVIESGLADIAWDYGKFREAKDDEAFAACEAWGEGAVWRQGRERGGVTPLRQTALAFCRECVEWGDARFTGRRDWIGYNWQADPTDPSGSGCAVFDYADLNAGY